VLHAVGVERPKAVIVLYTEMDLALLTVGNYRRAFPDIPIFAHATDLWYSPPLLLLSFNSSILFNACCVFLCVCVCERGRGREC
jgi:hypothetical protein